LAFCKHEIIQVIFHSISCHFCFYKIVFILLGQCHNLFITYFTFTFQESTFILQKRSLHRQIAKINPLESCFCWSLVSKRYQTMSICTMTLKSVCKIYPRRSIYHIVPGISTPASLSAFIWESRADTRTDMENVM
jgi:hypothetical protein